MKTRIAIVNGIRTPFCKANGVFKDLQADELGALVTRELFTRSLFDPALIDEVIFGNVLQPAHAINIARVISVKAGLSEKIPAFTVNRNCASGMEAVIAAADKIMLGQADIILAGGVESMSNFPLLYPKEMKDFLQNFSKSKSFFQTLRQLCAFRPRFLLPQIPSISDPLCGLLMGQTAELLNRDFKISRAEQDQFALESQNRAYNAITTGLFNEEIVPIPIPSKNQMFQQVDDGPRANQTLQALQKLKPIFEPLTGGVTAGNSSSITDGAVALMLMSEEKAKQLGLKPLGYLIGHACAGLEPSRMGLGPVYATAKLFAETGLDMNQIDLVEINEAFAGQVLAVVKAFASDEFAKNKLERTQALGVIDRNKLNVNGGAVALGHPLGASGARLILTLLLELKRRNKKLGLATLCVGGGQGEACLLEVAS